MSEVQKVVQDHATRKSEILEALRFTKCVEVANEAAVADYKNGGVKSVDKSFYIPKSARQLLVGMSRDQLQNMLSREVDRGIVSI